MLVDQVLFYAFVVFETLPLLRSSCSLNPFCCHLAGYASFPNARRKFHHPCTLSHRPGRSLTYCVANYAPRVSLTLCNAYTYGMQSDLGAFAQHRLGAPALAAFYTWAGWAS